MPARTDTPRVRREPVRTCVICRSRFPKGELARYVCPDPRERPGLVFDARRALPGRGFYLCPSEACRARFPRFEGWRKKCKGVSECRK